MRRAISNGIWLCQSCAKLIDSDISKYSVEVLQRWRTAAQKRAGDRLNRQLIKGGEATCTHDLEPILQNGYYEKRLPGCTIKYFLDGDHLHVEQELENGSVGYYVIDSGGNMIDHKLPYAMAEYGVEIEPTLVLSRHEEALPGGYTKETVVMKWGKRAVLTWDSEHRLTDYHFERGARIDNVRKVLLVEPPEFIKK